MPTGHRWRSGWRTKRRTWARAVLGKLLRIDKIIDAAQRHGAEAIHPGYGFLSENAEFAEACAAAGIVFIGPPAAAIRKMGSKTAARQVAIAAGAPVVPGTEAALRDPSTARSNRDDSSVIRCCSKPRRAEAAKACAAWIASRIWKPPCAMPRAKLCARFGNDEVYVEKLVRGAAAHRNPDPGRSSRPHDSSGRARMFHPAAASEGDRGVPFAGDARRIRSCASRWARRR